VGVHAGSAFFVGPGGEGTLRLSFSAVTEELIDEGVERLAGTIVELSGSPQHREAVEPAAAPVV
jgi:DNA-binding transcriptional MocR family regulator